jgi:uncharacterized protein DUF1353
MTEKYYPLQIAKIGTRGDRALWRLLTPFTVYDQTALRPWLGDAPLVVPEGFVTDLASVPRVALSITGDAAHEASVPHDYLYQTHDVFSGGHEPISQATVDRLFYDLMGIYGPTDWRRTMMYIAVRKFGFHAWSASRERLLALNPVVDTITAFA